MNLVLAAFPLKDAVCDAKRTPDHKNPYRNEVPPLLDVLKGICFTVYCPKIALSPTLAVLKPRRQGFSPDDLFVVRRQKFVWLVRWIVSPLEWREIGFGTKKVL